MLQTVRIMGSVFRKNFGCQKLQCHVTMLSDIVCQVLPDVKKVNSVRNMCSGTCTSSHRNMFSELHKLIHLYHLIVPVTSATSERAIHKGILDEMELGPIAVTFASANEEHVQYFGSVK